VRSFLRCGLLLRAAIALAFALCAAPASADLWAYVDVQGKSHVADRQVDARYKLFFKGATTLDVRNAEAATRARALDALAGTVVYQRMHSAAARAYDALIERNARVNGLDPALVKAVVAVESGFDPHAVSDKGAIGLMQVLPETGERYGVAADARRSVSDKLRDPAINVRTGARYLRDLLARFADAPALALAAYNAGEGTVELHGNNVPPFRETRQYVRLVQHVYALYRPGATSTPVRIVDPRKAVAREESSNSP
jgi:soluble lytic murein transglycosylase-like protein